jgi:hypothetical protein
VSTRKVSRLLGATLWQLRNLIRYGRIPRPHKEEGRFDWTPDDLMRARAALATVKRCGPRPRLEEVACAS